MSRRCAWLQQALSCAYEAVLLMLFSICYDMVALGLAANPAFSTLNMGLNAFSGSISR